MTDRQDEDAIHALLGAIKQAMKEHDARGVIACYSGDATAFDLPPPLVITKEAMHDPAGLERWFSTWTSGPNVTTHELTVHVHSDVAYAFGLQHMVGEQKDTGGADLWYRSSAFLRRDGGNWRIVHQHSSVPFAMDGSGRALLDLKPELEEA